MATLAVGGSKRRARTRVRRVGGPLPILHVAGFACGREAIEDACCCLFVAFLALHGSMRTQQGEAIHVVFDLLDGNVPALHRVTLLAVRPHLAAMDVLMAVGAILADVGEHRLDVTLNAIHFFVHTAKRVFCFAVVEFGNGANRPPTSGGVTVLARHGQRRSMGVASGLLLGLRCWGGRRTGTGWEGKKDGGSSGRTDGRNSQDCPESELEQRERKPLPA